MNMQQRDGSKSFGFEVRGFLVDLDGTLFFTHEANKCAYKEAFRKLGIPFDEDIFSKCLGMDFKTMMQTLCPSLEESKKNAIKNLKDEVYPSFFSSIRVNETLLKFLQSFKGKIHIGLVTTARRPNVSRILQHFDLESLFHSVVCGDDVREGKPSPEGYLICMEKMKLNANQCIAFEDSETGLKAAFLAGLLTVRV